MKKRLLTTVVLFGILVVNPPVIARRTVMARTRPKAGRSIFRTAPLHPPRLRPIRVGEPGYRRKLERDGEVIVCKGRGVPKALSEKTSEEILAVNEAALASKQGNVPASLGRTGAVD